MEKLPGEVTRLSPGNFSPPTFQTGRFPGETDVSPVKLPGEEFGLKGVLVVIIIIMMINFIVFIHGTVQKNTVMKIRPKQLVLHGQKHCPYSPQSKMQNLKITKFIINFKMENC